MNDFSALHGNSQIIQTLKNSVLGNRVLHAYIFEGPEGSGKKILANAFTKFIFCATKEPGCTCHSCTQFDSGNHSDLIYVRRGKNERSLGVDKIRAEVIEPLAKKPFEYSRKVIIIEEAELLTVGSQNALLRSIEEPPEFAVIILLARRLDFLPTVLSRCFLYKMRRFGSDFIFNYLKSAGFPERESVIASECAETIGRAVSLCSKDDFFEMRKQLFDSLAILSKKGLADFFSETAKLESRKEQAGELNALMLMWFRDVLAYKATENFSYVRQKDYKEQIAESARSFPFKSLYGKIRGIDEFSSNLAANVPFAAALDALAIRLAE